VLAAEIERVRAQHGHAILLDAHSIRSEVPRFFDGRLPDLNLGTARGASCAENVERLAIDVLAAARSFSHVANGRFTGGYVTRHYGRPSDGIHALQLEMAQTCYMDEASPFGYDPAWAAPLIAVLERLVIALSECRPAASKR
jgi:N-formylglutamate amidohydrolase